jgi:hypothetical protein
MLHFALWCKEQVKTKPTRTVFLHMTKPNVKNELDVPLALVVVSSFSGLHKMPALGLHILLAQTFAVNLINDQISQDILKRRDYDAGGYTWQ